MAAKKGRTPTRKRVTHDDGSVRVYGRGAERRRFARLFRTRRFLMVGRRGSPALFSADTPCVRGVGGHEKLPTGG